MPPAGAVQQARPPALPVAPSAEPCVGCSQPLCGSHRTDQIESSHMRVEVVSVKTSAVQHRGGV